MIDDYQIRLAFTFGHIALTVVRLVDFFNDVVAVRANSNVKGLVARTIKEMPEGFCAVHAGCQFRNRIGFHFCSVYLDGCDAFSCICISGVIYFIGNIINAAYNKHGVISIPLYFLND